MKIDPNHDSTQNDRALSRLYKSGAKNTPPPALDRKILDYAANNNKPGIGDSHFGGGWKVPLSLAASVLLVFTILLQLDKNPEQLPEELPPLPTSEKPDILSVPVDHDFVEDENRSLNEALEAQSKVNDNQDTIGLDVEEALKDHTTRVSPAVSENKAEARKKLQRQNQGVISQPKAILEQSAPSNNYRSRSEAEQKREIAPQETSQPIQEFSKEPTSKAKQSTAQENAAGENTTTENIGHKEAMQLESNPVLKPMPAGKDDSLILDKIGKKTEGAAEFATLPAHKWLQSIEELIINEDYAEASRQLKEFKQSHPEIDVADLEAKIPYLDKL